MNGSSLIGGGQFTGPSPTPLGSGVSRVLGLQGGALASLSADPGAVVSVFLVGDTSDRLSRGLVEGRGFAAGRITPGGNRVKMRINASTGGGIIIESFSLIPDGSSSFDVDVRATPITIGAPIQVQQTPVGGQPLVCSWEAGDGGAEAVGGAEIASNLLASTLVELRWFVPSGQWLVIQSTNTQACNYGVIWRELEE